MLVIQTAKMYFSLQEFWQTKYLITNQLCIFCGFGGKNFTFESLCEAVLILTKSMIRQYYLWSSVEGFLKLYKSVHLFIMLWNLIFIQNAYSSSFYCCCLECNRSVNDLLTYLKYSFLSNRCPIFSLLKKMISFLPSLITK